MRVSVLFCVFTMICNNLSTAQSDKLVSAVRLGSDGLPAIEIATPLTGKKMWLRVQGAFLKIAIEDFVTDLGGRLSFELLLDGSVDMHHVALWVDIPPWQKKDWFRICGGIGLFATSELSGKIQLAGTFRFNDIDFTPEEIGYWSGRVNYPIPFAPYAGIALGRIVPKKRIGVNLDVGTYYRLKHRISVTATNLLRGNEEKAERLTQLTHFLRWLPVFSIRLTYKLFNHQTKLS